MEALHIARADGSYSKELSLLAKQQLLILDDWGSKTQYQNKPQIFLKSLRIDMG